jgi:tRNA-dihydrouridine synthase
MKPAADMRKLDRRFAIAPMLDWTDGKKCEMRING